jgi:hypothetical protein
MWQVLQDMVTRAKECASPPDGGRPRDQGAQMSLFGKAKCTMGRHSGAWSLPASRCEIVRTCDSCGKVEERSRHSWGQFGYVAGDQCDEVRRCQRCGMTESRVRHEWGPWLYLDEEVVTAQFHKCRRCHQTERTRRFSTW